MWVNNRQSWTYKSFIIKRIKKSLFASSSDAWARNELEQWFWLVDASMDVIHIMWNYSRIF